MSRNICIEFISHINSMLLKFYIETRKIPLRMTKKFDKKKNKLKSVCSAMVWQSASYGNITAYSEWIHFNPCRTHNILELKVYRIFNAKLYHRKYFSSRFTGRQLSIACREREQTFYKHCCKYYVRIVKLSEEILKRAVFFLYKYIAVSLLGHLLTVVEHFFFINGRQLLLHH